MVIIAYFGALLSEIVSDLKGKKKKDSICFHFGPKGRIVISRQYDDGRSYLFRR